jgi:short-subunit dehydrogenase
MGSGPDHQTVIYNGCTRSKFTFADISRKVKMSDDNVKKAIIVGATSGIGRQLAKLLTDNNYRVGITGRRSEILEEIKSECPDLYYISAFDVALPSNVQHLEKLLTELGGLDLIVFSSGTGELNEPLDFDIEKRTIDTNIVGFTCVVDWAFNYFKRQGYGHLLGISSVGGHRGSRHSPAYNATKAYQINYLEALRQKATHDNLPICVTDIRPGFVATAMAKGEGKFWVATAQKAADQIWIAIKKGKKIAYITKRWQIVAVVLKYLPRRLYDRI